MICKRAYLIIISPLYKHKTSSKFRGGFFFEFYSTANYTVRLEKWWFSVWMIKSTLKQLDSLI